MRLAALLVALLASHATLAKPPIGASAYCGYIEVSDARWEVRLNVVTDYRGVIRVVSVDPNDPAADQRSPLFKLGQLAVHRTMSPPCNAMNPVNYDVQERRVDPSYDVVFRGY